MSAVTTDDDLFLTVNVRSRSSGLQMNIWIGPRGRAGHAARINAQTDHRQQFDLDRLAVVGVDPPALIEGDLSPADLALVREYVALNRQAILDHWNENTDGVELSRALRSRAP
ncbi:MAG: DUF4160 domain-containing protein [Hyphomicrobiales bacterium]|nr:DUF4160 domain-containing protein [Hyphomicrobiales bacterium]